MAADIFYLQKFRSVQATLGGDHTVTSPLDRLRERASLISEAIARKTTAKGLSQRTILAQNLWTLLEELEKRGTRKVDIVREAGLGSSLSSTKSLYNYTLDPSKAAQEDALSLDRRLIKNVGKYLRLLQAAARLSHQDYEQLLVRFVAGSEYDVSLDSNVRFSEATAYREIAAFLADLGERLEAKYRMSEFYQYVSNRDVTFNNATNSFNVSAVLRPRP